MKHYIILLALLPGLVLLTGSCAKEAAHSRQPAINKRVFFIKLVFEHP